MAVKNAYLGSRIVAVCSTPLGPETEVWRDDNPRLEQVGPLFTGAYMGIDGKHKPKLTFRDLRNRVEAKICGNKSVMLIRIHTTTPADTIHILRKKFQRLFA